MSSCPATIANRTEKLLGLFDHYRDWLLKGGLRGCAYVNLEDDDRMVVVAQQLAAELIEASLAGGLSPH